MSLDIILPNLDHGSLEPKRWFSFTLNSSFRITLFSISLSLSLSIYIYIYVCVCVCVCVYKYVK